MAYLELVDCVWLDKERWHLRDVTDASGNDLTWEFCRCTSSADKIGLRTSVYKDGPQVDFTIAGIDTPILSPRALEILRPVLSEFCEFLPIEIQNRSAGYALLNILKAEDCVDEDASELMFWTKDGPRPDKAGSYRMITKLVLKKELSLPPIFRLRKAKNKMFVNHTVADLFAAHQLSGISLEER